MQKTENPRVGSSILSLGTIAFPRWYTWRSQCLVPGNHPKTGISWFRKRVPDELRGLIGKL